MRAIPHAPLPGAVPEAPASPAARPESRSFMSRVRDRAAALVGSKTRTALMAFGLGLGLGGGAAAEDAAKTDAPSAAGAKMEMGTPGATVDRPAVSAQNPVVNLADLLPAKPAAAPADAASQVLLASAETDANKKAKEAADLVPAKPQPKILSIEEYVRNSDMAAKYGLTGAFPDAYVAYRAQLAEWRAKDPKDVRSYERSSGKVTSAYVVEGRFAEVAYPENVVDAYNRRVRVPAESLELGRKLNAESLRAELPAMFGLGLDDAWAKLQVEMENPAALDDDGKLKPEVVLEDTKDTMARRARRWEAKLWPKDPAEAKKAQDARLAEKASAALNALHRLYQEGLDTERVVKFNPAAVRDERTAALSWVAVKEGFGEERPDALLIQKDLATLTIAWQARKDSKAMERIPMLHVGRVKDLSGSKSLSDTSDAYLASLVFRAKAAVPAADWSDLLARSKPAGFDAGSTEHLESLLVAVRDDVALPVPQAFRNEVSRALSRSLNVPLVSADQVMDALEGYGAMTGRKGSPEYASDRELVGKLIPKAFEGALGLSTEIPGIRKATEEAAVAKQEAAVAKQEAAVAKQEAAVAKQEAAEAGRALKATQKLNALLDEYEKAGDAEKRRVIAKEMTDIIATERAKIMAIPEKNRDALDNKSLLVYKLLEAKISQDVAKNG